MLKYCKFDIAIVVIASCIEILKGLINMYVHCSCLVQVCLLK